MPYRSREERHHFGRKPPPPDYFSRSMQFRLLTMVFCLMLVVVLMRETRKAENWKWLWAFSEQAPSQPAVQDGIDTRLIPASPVSVDLPGTVYSSDSTAAEMSRQIAEAAGEAEAIQRVQREVWRRLLLELDDNERRTLDRVLRCARETRELDAETFDRWRTVFTVLDDGWKKYLQQTRASASEADSQLAAAQSTHMQSTLDACEQAWNTQLSVALRAPLDERSWSIQERDSLQQLQSLFDDLALAEVRDDMVARPSERTAWFRLFEKLQLARTSVPLGASEEGDGDEVSFVQLFRQPKEYRGRLVTVRGTTQLAYRVPAIKNDLGIEEYVVLWLMPADGAGSPFVIYALDTPPGFPQIGQKETSVREEVTCTGYFFKRWVYNAHDGVRTAPLLLVDSPVWYPTPSPAVTTWPNLGAALMVVAALLLVAVTIARAVYLTSTRLPSAAKIADRSRSRAQEFAALEKEDVAPGVKESLRRMAEDAQRDEA